MVKIPIEQVCEELRGTCDPHNQFDPNDYTQEELRWLDEQVRCCDTCGWWCETDEMVTDDNGQDCNDCKEASEEYGDDDE